MMTLFKSQNLWDIVNEPQNTSILNEAQRKELVVKDASALYLIQQSLAKIPIQLTPWDAAMGGDWKRMMDYYRDEEYLGGLSSPVTHTLDTVLHLAVHDKVGKQYCEELLEIVSKKQPLTEYLMKQNTYGNTALHEATIYSNYKAVKLLVERCPDHIEMKNKFGETPLFTAAGFAATEIVEFLIGSGLKQCLGDDGCLLSIHSKRKDELSILSVAIIGQKFGNNFCLHRILIFKKYTYIRYIIIFVFLIS
ncbi:ankyrin repeat-containing protein [Salix suchowensis]|nr:ankyrin repeat-containing protein [Salix suchowensis]